MLVSATLAWEGTWLASSNDHNELSENELVILSWHHLLERHLLSSC